MALSRFQKAAAAGAAVAALCATVPGASASAAAPAPPGARTAARTAAHAGPAGSAAPLSRTIGQGRVDGLDWTVTLAYLPALPAGHGTPGDPSATGLLCRRMVIGGVLIDRQGGPWADCSAVEGAHDPAAAGDEGLWGLHDKGTTGSRLFVGTTGATVAYGVVALTDGAVLTGRAATVPATSYRGWAAAIPDGGTIASVDTYDARHRRLSHETYWS